MPKVNTKSCPDCISSGKRNKGACNTCNGSGFIVTLKSEKNKKSH